MTKSTQNDGNRICAERRNVKNNKKGLQKCRQNRNQTIDMVDVRDENDERALEYVTPTRRARKRPEMSWGEGMAKIMKDRAMKMMTGEIGTDGEQNAG